jgi:glycosyltransferase involved in cell wall biosynthesis
MTAPETSVLIFSNCFPPNVGGVETHLDDLTRELVARGWRVDVLSLYPLTTRAPWKRYEETGGIRIWRLWWFGQGWFHVLEKFPPLQFLYLVPRLFWGGFWWLVARGGQVRAIHAHGLAAAAAARALGPLFGKRLVMSSHAVYNLRKGSLLERVIGWILRGFDHVIAMSNQSLEELVVSGVPPEKAGRFSYWIDLNTFQPRNPAACRQKLGLPQDRFVCLFVGRLLAIKGVRVMLEASRDPRFAEARFVFAGVGPLADEVAAAAKAQANVVFAGNVANKDLADYYSAADVLCAMPLYQEGFPRVTLESVGCGLPVIGADCPGVRDATSPDVAWVIPPSAEAFKETLARLVSNPGEARARRPACRRFAEERYSARNVEAVERALLG